MAAPLPVAGRIQNGFMSVEGFICMIGNKGLISDVQERPE